MKEQEKKFFLALCRFAGKDLEPSLTAYATPGVLGQLFYNRLAGVAHETATAARWSAARIPKRVGKCGGAKRRP
mgnify:CR=1 FL=1